MTTRAGRSAWCRRRSTGGRLSRGCSLTRGATRRAGSTWRTRGTTAAGGPCARCAERIAAAFAAP
eukprot:3672915-Pyramimonas_sp.AAC.1